MGGDRVSAVSLSPWQSWRVSGMLLGVREQGYCLYFPSPGEDSLRNCAFGPGGKSSVGDRARVTDTFSSVTLPTVKLVTAKL